MREVSGKWVILTIASLAFAATIGTLWFHYERGHLTARFWGPEVGELIGRAPRVECRRLELVTGSSDEPGDTSSNDGAVDAATGQAEIVRLGGRSYRVVQSRSLDRAKGFGNLRWALTQDASYDWPATTAWQKSADSAASGADSTTKNVGPQWEFALRFRRDAPATTESNRPDRRATAKREVTLMFSSGEPPLLTDVGSDRVAVLDRRVADGIRHVIEEFLFGDLP